MYDTGARVSEMAGLTVDSVRIRHEPYTIRLFGKGRKARIVPLVKEQVEILREYMEENHLNDSNKAATLLFYNNRYEKLTREALEKAYTDLTPNQASDRAWERSKDLRDWLKGLKY